MPIRWVLKPGGESSPASFSEGIMDIKFPMKGLDTSCRRNEQTSDSSPSLLNVLPYDRYFRRRGASRAGVSKFFATQLGSGSFVQHISTIALALDPSSITPNVNVYSKTFVAANGTSLSAVGAPDWTCFNDFKNLLFPTHSSGSVQDIQSNRVERDGTSNVAGAATPVSAPVIGSAYIIKMTGVWTGSATNIDSWRGILSKMTPSGREGVGFFCDGANLKISSASDHSTSGVVALAGTLTGTHTMELHVNGNNFSGWLDGVQKCTLNSTINASSTALGFMEDNGVKSGQGFTTFDVFTGSPLAAFRQVDLVAVVGGQIYIAAPASGGTVVAVGSASQFSSITRVQSAPFAGKCYMTDGLSPLQVLDCTAQSTAAIVPSAGSETATTLGAYQLACTWRGRIVLAASTAFPQNFVMSRQNAPLDWDYSQTDSAAAVAGNASKAGAIGVPLNALIPWTEDLLVLGGDSTIHLVQGDIAAGGQIILVTEAVGTLGPQAWCVDPSGSLYFVGTDGLYRWDKGSQPTLVSDAVRQSFAGLDRSAVYIQCVWDRDRNGLWVLSTSVLTGTSTHFFCDATTGGWFPIQFPDTIGPIVSCMYDGNTYQDRTILLGGRDGYIRKLDFAAINDDGTDITSYVTIGPIRPSGDGAESVLEALELISGDVAGPFGLANFSDNQFECQIVVASGKDARSVLINDTDDPRRTFTTVVSLSGRGKRLIQRNRGGTFAITVSGTSGKMWTMEKLVAMFVAAGLQRRY